MLGSVSTLGILGQDLSIIRNSQRLYQDLSYQVATGKKYRELKDYQANAPLIIDLNQEIEARTAYQQSIDLANLNVEAYDSTLERLVDVAQDMAKAADTIGTSDPNWESDTLTLVDNMMLEVESLLNTQIGDRHIYAGSRYSTAPTIDLRTLTVFDNVTPPPGAFLVANPNVPEYDTSFVAPGPTANATAYDLADVTIDVGLQIQYGISADDDAFQRLVHGLRVLKSAAQPISGVLTTADREQYLGIARQQAQLAQDAIRQLQSSNGAVMSKFARTKDLHSEFIGIANIALDGIEVVDSAVAATKLSTLTAQIEVSYATISRKAELSLVNFLR